MGTWGHLPWDNDSAVDWFGDTFDRTKLAQRVEETLHLRAYPDNPVCSPGFSRNGKGWRESLRVFPPKGGATNTPPHLSRGLFGWALSVDDSADEIRAAAAVVVDRHLGLAADRLEAIKNSGVYAEAPEIESSILSEIEELRSRLKDQLAHSAKPQPQKKWWEFWK